MHRLVRLVRSAVDPAAGGQRRVDLLGRSQAPHALINAGAGFEQERHERRDVAGAVFDVVDRDPVGRGQDRVDDVIDLKGDGMDVLAIERRYEGAVQLVDQLGRGPDIGMPGLTQGVEVPDLGRVAANQALKATRRFEGSSGRGFQHLEERQVLRDKSHHRSTPCQLLLG
jgi:hypothetical protein